MKCYILIGNTGAGKSRWTNKFLGNKDAAVICKDTARYWLGNGIYIFDPNIEHVLHNLTLAIFELTCYRKETTVLDETNMTREVRAPYIKIAKKYGYEIIAVDFPRLPKDVALSRRKKDDLRNISLDTWGDIWDTKNSRYEIPDWEEGFDGLIWLDYKDVGVKNI